MLGTGPEDDAGSDAAGVLADTAGAGDVYTADDIAWSEAEKAYAERNRAQAEAALPHACEHGLQVEVFLPSTHAEDILRAVIAGDYASPEEAIFVLLGEMLEMRAHPDLRREALARSLEKAMEGPFLSSDAVFADLRSRMAAYQPPAVWQAVRMTKEDDAPEAAAGERAAAEPGPDGGRSNPI